MNSSGAQCVTVPVSGLCLCLKVCVCVCWCKRKVDRECGKAWACKHSCRALPSSTAASAALRLDACLRARRRRPDSPAPVWLMTVSPSFRILVSPKSASCVCYHVWLCVCGFVCSVFAVRAIASVWRVQKQDSRLRYQGLAAGDHKAAAACNTAAAAAAAALKATAKQGEPEKPAGAARAHLGREAEHVQRVGLQQHVLQLWGAGGCV